VACAIGPSVTTSSIDFPFQNLFFWNLFEFSVKNAAFNIQELLHRKSKRHGPKPHALLLVKSFPKTPSKNKKIKASQFGGSHNYKTKQNKLPSFEDRCFSFQFLDVAEVVRTIEPNLAFNNRWK
jgi:hypothetical protein